MASSTRIKGRKLALLLGSPGTDVWADITSYSLEPTEADNDVVTFADVDAGGAWEWLLKLSAIQSTDPESFWRMVWDQSGEEVAFTLAPHGNTTPTPEQPHFLGTVKIGAKPRIGGDAVAGGTTFTFDTEWKVIGEPTMDTGIEA